MNGLLKVASPYNFSVGEDLIGETSGTKSIITEYTSYNTLYEVGSSSIVKEGWKTNSGFLNDNQQRIFDSNYYQYFSYSLQSEVEYSKWNEPVSSLNHTSGFKKFSDLIAVSYTHLTLPTKRIV